MSMKSAECDRKCKKYSRKRKNVSRVCFGFLAEIGDFWKNAVKK